MTAGPVFSDDNTVIMILLLMIKMVMMMMFDDDDDDDVSGWRHQSQLHICWSEWGISARET